MNRWKSALAVFASLCLVGCSSVDLQTRIRNYTSNVPDLDPADVHAFVDNQDAILADFARLAGVPVPAAGGEWRQVIDAGIHYADVRCDRFMDSLFWFNRVRETTSRQIQFTGAAASAALAVLHASANAIGLTPLGFTFLDQTVNNFGSGLLFDLNPNNVRTIVERKQAAYIAGLSASYTSRALALQVIQNYATICLPPSIETQVEEAIAAREYTPDQVVPPLPPGPDDVVPNAFGFPALENQPQSTLLTSAWARVTGIGAAAPIEISGGGGEYQIGGGGAWVKDRGTIAPGQIFRVRVKSAAAPATATVTTLTIGGISGNFSVTTASGPAEEEEPPAEQPPPPEAPPAQENAMPNPQPQL
jgi:hypothetical protein